MTASYKMVGRADGLGSPVLIHGLSGFMDAGGAARLAVEHILESTEHYRLATFDIDDVFDYRARRPRTVFDADHYSEMSMPELAVDAAVDEHGERFLVLSGAEPDLAWSRLTDSLIELIRGLGTRLVVGVHAIPWPAPHTRPVNVTIHGTEPSLIAGNRPWVGSLEVPGSLSALLEYRLGQTGVPAIGFAAHVPHYLVQAEYPRGAVALLESVAASTGLALPLAELREAAEESDADIGIQIAANAENLEAVATLEAQHDAMMSARATGAEGPAAMNESDIADQVEAFLAKLERGEG
ncbi:MAG: PAC2 family protein [Candidatus Nanopelagicales bacterium]